MDTTKETANRPQQLSLHNKNRLITDYNSNEVSLQPLSEVQSRVELPDRFKYGIDDATRSIGDRHQDMDTALQWIRQEIRGLKEADRRLMRQLLGLRAVIHKMQGGIQSCPSLATSSSAVSLDRSMFSAISVPLCAEPFEEEEFEGSGAGEREEIISAPCTDRALSASEMLQDFYHRTLSLKDVDPLRHMHSGETSDL